MIRLSSVLASAGGCAFSVAILFPSFAPAPLTHCGVRSSLTNVKQQALGLIFYTSDSDDRFPPRDVWVDVTYPYLKNPDVYHRPESPPRAWSYAFDAALDRVKTPPEAAFVPLVYESVNPTKNASDPFTSLPNPGLHDGKDDVAYADGHARAVAP